MRVLTINELMRMTRKELCGLAAHIAARLPTYREGSAGPYRGAHQPAQHSLGSGAAGFLAVRRLRLDQDRGLADAAPYIGRGGPHGNA